MTDTQRPDVDVIRELWDLRARDCERGERDAFDAALAALTTRLEQAEGALRELDKIVERSAWLTGCRGCIETDNRIHATADPTKDERCPTCGSDRGRIMAMGCHDGTTPDPWHRAAMLRQEAAEWDADIAETAAEHAEYEASLGHTKDKTPEEP